MDNIIVYYYWFWEKRLSFEDKFDLIGMYYDICSNGVILCLIKFIFLEFKDYNFNMLNIVDFKFIFGYVFDYIVFD